MKNIQPLGQLRWTYLDDVGTLYNVGLFHGENTGHVMLYVNSKIVLIDFSIFKSKKYSLYIGEELCDIVLEKKEDSFAYGLIPDKTADTDLNRARRKRAMENNIKTFIFGVLLVGLIISLSAFMISCGVH